MCIRDRYDIVCNGVELSSGALRNHVPEITLRAFALAGYKQREVEERFGALLRAFAYGAPPHGGAAPGLDRIIMLLSGADHLRDVIAFPMNQQARDLTLGAPSPLDKERLRELELMPLPKTKS